MAGSEDDGAERPFDATPRKLEEARRKGEVPVSHDLITAAVFAAMLLAATISGTATAERAGSALAALLGRADTLSTAVFSGGRVALGGAVVQILLAMGLWLALPYVFALAAAGLQRALIFVPDKLTPKLSRISPASLAKQKYGRDGLFNFVKSFVKLAVYSIVLAMVFADRAPEILAMPGLTLPASLTLVARLCFTFLAASLGVMVTIGVLDYLWQRMQFLDRQRMSLKELRDEMKETEGDPHTKQARRQKGYDIATRRMIGEVPQADVVIVNPVHYSVALKWTREPGSAPVCLAKGVDEIAARIREAAAEHGVPVYRDPPTARALHATVEIGAEIRPEHYRAVAAAIRFAGEIRERASRPWRR